MQSMSSALASHCQQTCNISKENTSDLTQNLLAQIASVEGRLFDLRKGTFESRSNAFADFFTNAESTWALVVDLEVLERLGDCGGDLVTDTRESEADGCSHVLLLERWSAEPCTRRLYECYLWSECGSSRSRCMLSWSWLAGEQNLYTGRRTATEHGP